MKGKKYFFSLPALFLLLFIFAFTQSSNSQMVWNQAASFSGTNSSYIAVKNSASLNITASFSLEAWINPAENLGTNQTIISKGSGLIYTIRLTATGRILIATNGSSRLSSKTIVPKNSWTHVAGTYNSTSGLFTIYLNGNSDTSAVVAGSAPSSSTDTLFIGNAANSTPFKGYIDEIRIWNKNLSSLEVNTNFRTSLGVNSGIYGSLVMSLTFQSVADLNTPFSLIDRTGNANNGINRGVIAYDQSDRPSSTFSLNQSLELNGAVDYAASPNFTDFTPSTGITLEAWIFPRSGGNSGLIHKGPSGGGGVYRLGIVGNKLFAGINSNFTFTSNDTIPLNEWSHVAFTYLASTGHYNFYINGKNVDSGTNAQGLISSSTDSLYIGGTPSLLKFNGFIDEVRIFSYARSQSEINRSLFKSLDYSDFSISGGTTLAVIFNLDGLAESSTLTFSRLYFRSNSRFSSPSTLINQPVSPLDKATELNFQDGFYLKTSDRRIPQTGTSGTMKRDSLDIILDETITDLNLFIALNHSYSGDLDISLVGPNGDEVFVYSGSSLMGNDIGVTTIFDDQADSSINNSNRFVTFSPKLKPNSNLNSTFSGDNTKGIWKLKINDGSAGDTGRVYGWGIQFNNAASKSHLLLTNALIQGFYNEATNQSVRDTISYFFRKNSSPYTISDSVKLYIPLNGTSLLNLTNVSDATDYYIQLKHRNSITTWSSVPVNFDPLTSQADYRFNTSESQAYNNNQTLVDSTPVRFAMFSGDVNQNKFVDLADVTLTYNDASSFVTGYKVTDVNGDNISDLFDLLIVYNNSSAFVQAYEPPVSEPLSIGVKEIKHPDSSDPATIDVSSDNPVLPIPSQPGIKRKGN